MTEEKPSALPSLPELPDALKKQSPAAIAGRIKAEYDKVNGVYASYTKDATPLRPLHGGANVGAVGRRVGDRRADGRDNEISRHGRADTVHERVQGQGL